jgi:hypothetical protein
VKAICKVKTEQIAPCYDVMYGAAVVVKLEPSQVWRVAKHSHYYYAKRGTCTLRLTRNALDKLFEIEEAHND